MTRRPPSSTVTSSPHAVRIPTRYAISSPLREPPPMMTNAAALALTQLAAARDPMEDLPVGVWIATAFFVVVGLVVMVLYLITLQGAMNSVGEGVRPFNG